MNFDEAKGDLARKLNIDYSDIANNDMFTDADLAEWINHAVLRAWDYKPWDFSEALATSTTTGSPIAYPTTFVSSSIFLLRVNGKEYTKLAYKDYLKYLECYPSGTDRVWAEYKRSVYINGNAYTVGQTYEFYGKSKATQLSSSGDLMPFSPDTDNQEYSGNDAVVLLAYSEALSSEKKKNPSQGQIEEARAYRILDLLWKPFTESHANEQMRGRAMFDVPNYFPEGNRARQSPIGNFEL
jgi:hypothetical protein